jgi:hypothetical protein
MIDITVNRQKLEIREETGTHLVMTAICFSCITVCYAKNSESSTWGLVYHVLNRSVGRIHMFRKEADFEAFDRVMIEAHQRQPIRILSHWGRKRAASWFPSPSYPYCFLPTIRAVRRSILVELSP